ncbi:MAG TPA: 2-phospho-L-lactate guanylyltransferase [Anaerolineae bacterium]
MISIHRSSFSTRDSIWAVVPVKPLRRAKSRLARALKANQRAALARSMFARTLDVLASVDRVSGIAVISNDLTVQEIARAKHATPLAEAGSGLNAAVSEACAWATAQGASGALIVPTDLPLLTTFDLDALIDLAIEPECVILAPDRRDDGTNVLLLKPPQAIQPAFGVASFESHYRRARQTGRPVRVYRSLTIGLDIDRPADLERYNELAALDALTLYE